MDVEFRYRGQTYSSQEIAFVRQLLESNPNASRRALSEKLCVAWNWVQANGALRDMVCRSFMLELERAGHIVLPTRKQIPQVKKICFEEQTALLDRLKNNALTPEDCEIVRCLFETLEFIFEIMSQKNAQLKTLLRRILGIKSERSKKIRDKLNPKNSSEDQKPPEADVKDELTADVSSDPTHNEKTKGHGRIGADAHTGADRVLISLTSSSRVTNARNAPGERCTRKTNRVFLFALKAGRRLAPPFTNWRNIVAICAVRRSPPNCPGMSPQIPKTTSIMTRGRKA